MSDITQGADTKTALERVGSTPALHTTHTL